MRFNQTAVAVVGAEALAQPASCASVSAVLLPAGSAPRQASVSPDGTALWVTDATGRVWVIDTGLAITVSGANAALVGSVSWDLFANGRVLLTTPTLHTSYIYAAPGTFPARVTVRSTSGGILLTKTVPVSIQSPLQAIRTAAGLTAGPGAARPLDGQTGSQLVSRSRNSPIPGYHMMRISDRDTRAVSDPLAPTPPVAGLVPGIHADHRDKPGDDRRGTWL